MSRIRSSNTSPELAVRRYLHANGLRYRLHSKGLPGRPDIVFPTRRACVFVHGCFWHGCPRCIDGTRKVKSNVAFWEAKVRGNQERDERNTAKLEADGWSVAVIWECETSDATKLAALASAVRDRPIRRQPHKRRGQPGEPSVSRSAASA